MKALFKALIVAILITAPVMALDAGIKVFSNYVESVGIGGGAGVFGQFPITKHIVFYPGIDILYVSDKGSDLEHQVISLDIPLNFKMWYEIINGLKMYAGAGIAPQVYASKWVPSDNEKFSPKTDFGADAFIGFDFLIGSKTIMLELQQGMITEYNATKFCIGFIF